MALRTLLRRPCGAPDPPGLSTGVAGALAVLLLVGVMAGPAAAQDTPTVRAHLDRSEVAVNQPFTFSVEVSGVRGLDGEPEFPELDGFARYLGSNQSTSMRVVNGQASVSVTVAYRWVATVEGTHEIPPLDVRAGGTTLTTEPLTLTVTAAGSGSGTPRADPAQDGDGPVVDEDDIFVVAEVGDRAVYENEPVFVSYRIFTRVNVNSYQITSSPSTEGFWSEELPTPEGGPQVEQVTRDGVRYASAVVRRVALFPTGPGTRTIEPLEVEARVRVDRRRSGDPFSDVFGGRSLFASLAPVVVSSEPVEIEVRALPPGAPADFRGFVGELDVATRVDRDSVDAGEAVTFVVTARGEGNLGGLPAPGIDFPTDFEVFDPEVIDDITIAPDRVGGTRSFEYVLIPRAPGDRELPPVSISYFDPETGAYRTASAPAIPLEVTGTAPPTGTRGLRSGVETLREDIRFIRLGAPRLHRRDRGLLHLPGFWIVALLPLTAMAGAVALRRHRDRLEGDLAYARGRRAGRVAKKRLARARSLAADEGDRDFYAEAGRALQGFLADKLNLPEAGLMTEAVRDELARRGVGGSVAEEYLDCIGHCDRQRFAPSGGGQTAHERFLERCEAAMTALDGELDR